jgi:HEXXH motif-containing protein
MIGRHDLTPAQLAALAGGYGGAETIVSLSKAQLSKHLLLIKFIVATWIGDPEHRDSAVAALTRAQAAAPQVVADVLADPLVGAWAARTTRRLRGTLRSDVPLRTECNQLSAIAVAAAALAGTEARLVVHAGGAGVIVPRLGRAAVPVPAHTPVAASVRAGSVSIEGAARWQPLHTLTATSAGRTISVVLDDLDPYRGGHHAPPAPRLDRAEVTRWSRTFAAGWELIARYAPERAEELSAGLRTLVPLTQLDPHSARSATIRDAFGAFGLTRPATAADFAAMLVHEFQHSKLSGVLDIQPLFDASSPELHFAPWRTDPRPVGGLIQGIYAFLGIADLWNRLRECPELAQQAEQEFADVREQVKSALTSLEGSAALNPTGRRFTADMRAAFDVLAAEPLAPAVVRRAEKALDGKHAGWRERNTAVLGG